MGRGTIGDEDLRSRGLWYGWDQNSLSIEPPLDDVSLDDLGQRFATGQKVRPQLAGAYAHLSVHELRILNHAIEEHRPNWDSATLNSLLRAIKLWYLIPALLHAPDGQIKKRQRFALVESGDIVILLLWLMAFTRGGDPTQPDAAKKLRRAGSSNGRRRREATREAQSGSAQPSGKATNTGKRGNVEHTDGQVPLQAHVAESAAAADAVLLCATEGEDGNALPWRPEVEYASEVLFDVISSPSALSGSRKDDQRFAHLQSIIHTDIGREEFARGMTTFWRRIVDEPDVFPPEFWQFVLQSSLTALGGKCQPVA